MYLRSIHHKYTYILSIVYSIFTYVLYIYSVFRYTVKYTVYMQCIWQKKET